MVAVGDIKHIQVSLKVQSTNESAVNPTYSPDRQVLYIRSTGTEVYGNGKVVALFEKEAEGDNCILRIPYRCFSGNTPQKGVTYTCQIRFGSTDIWAAGSGIDGRTDFTNFAAWRNASTAMVPSAFGEWSNLQTVYCHGTYSVNAKYGLDDFVPEVTFTFEPEEDNALEQVKIVYIYDERINRLYKTMVFNGQRQQDGTYSVTAKIPIAPITTIAVSFEGVTKNNTLVGGTLMIPGIQSSKQLPFLNGEIQDTPLTGEEANDGCLAKTFVVAGTDTITIADTDVLAAYRVNLFNFDTIKVTDDVPGVKSDGITIKDYSVEMGEDYMYVGLVRDKYRKPKGLVMTPFPWGFKHPGYARLMRMDSIFLTTRKHQLRLQGNVSVSSLKRNTQDQFQTTIGSQYPFYSRHAKTDYRTFSLSGVVSIAFDPTATFFENDTYNGLWWKTEEESQLIIMNRDLYNKE